MTSPIWEFSGFYIFILLSFVQESLALRCYECNPNSAFSTGGSGSYSSSFSSSSGSSTSALQTDCYNADSRQIRDCAWDVTSCYTVVMPGPTSGSSPPPSSAGGPASPAAAQQSQVVSRGCGRAPHAKPGEVAEDECKMVTPPPGSVASRVTVCQCKSDLCNDKRPDQLPGSGLSSAANANYASMSGSGNWISPYGSGTPFPGGPYRDYSMYGNPYGNYGGNPNLTPGYPPMAGRASNAYGPAPSNFNQQNGFYTPSGFSQGSQTVYPMYPYGPNQFRPNGYGPTAVPQNDALDKARPVYNPATGQYEPERKTWTSGGSGTGTWNSGAAGTGADGSTEYVVTSEREFKANFNNYNGGKVTVSVSVGMLLLGALALVL